MILFVLGNQLWMYPVVSRRDGPPHGRYSIEVPAGWTQNYLANIDLFTLRPDVDGLATPVLFISKVKTIPEGTEQQLLDHYKTKFKATDAHWAEDVEIDGGSHKRIDLELPQLPDPLKRGMAPESRGFLVLLTGKEHSYEVRFTCKASLYQSYAPTALEATRSIRF